LPRSTLASRSSRSSSSRMRISTRPSRRSRPHGTPSRSRSANASWAYSSRTSPIQATPERSP
jgi:hypothetical protein